jgi:phosphoglycolate phosphatase
MNVIFDLDGTLIDSRRRLYELFSALVPKSTLSFNEYWRLKRQRINHEFILTNYFNYTQIEIFKFQEVWLSLIESPNYIRLDTKIDGVINVLEALYPNNILYLCTARQFNDSTVEQLKSLGLYNYFKKILVTQNRISKVDLILQNVNLTPSDWLVGDTGQDVMVGKALNIMTCSVFSGFLDKGILEEYHPDVITSSVIDLPSIIS